MNGLLGISFNHKDIRSHFQDTYDAAYYSIVVSFNLLTIVSKYLISGVQFIVHLHVV